MDTLQGTRVAALVADGFEEVELTKPLKALKQAGIEVDVVSPVSGMVRAWASTDWGESVTVDVELDQAKPDRYDALLLPGGVLSPDTLRVDKSAVKFVQHFVDKGKTIAAICHGPWTLIETGGVKGRRMTSYPSLRTDLVNAGAEWVDEEVVVDGGFITSRDPDDLQAFIETFIEVVSGVHQG